MKGQDLQLVEILKTLASLRKHIDNLEKDRMDFEQRVTQHLEQVLMECLGKIRKSVEGTEREMKDTKRQVIDYALKTQRFMDAASESMEAMHKYVKSLEDLIHPETFTRFAQMVEKLDRAMKLQKKRN